MKNLTTSADPIHPFRFLLRTLAICLVVGLMTLPALATAQATEESESTEPQAAETPSDESLETQSNPEGCPCCGQKGRGQGGGKGRQGGGRGQGCKGCGQGRQGQGGGGQMKGPGRPEAQVIHFLIENHESLERSVEEIPGGVRTRTVSKDPEIIDAVRIHVRQMVDLIHGGGRIRNWDPLFVEIFDHREAIEMEITDIEGGVEVTETSGDDQVALLIRAHAVKVEEFVARGLEAYREETPLPDEYSDASP